MATRHAVPCRTGTLTATKQAQPHLRASPRGEADSGIPAGPSVKFSSARATRPNSSAPSAKNRPRAPFPSPLRCPPPPKAPPTPMSWTPNLPPHLPLHRHLQRLLHHLRRPRHPHRRRLRRPRRPPSRKSACKQIEWVLHTHHHRDQSWGTPRLRDSTAPKSPSPNTNATSSTRPNSSGNTSASTTTTTTATPSSPSPKTCTVDADLQDYETFTWRDVQLEIIPAKGHTHGSSMLIGQHRRPAASPSPATC